MPVDVLLVLGLSAGIIGFALWQGSKPEIVGGVIVALGWLGDFAVALWTSHPGFFYFSDSRFFLDCVEFALLAALALSANRVWPIFAAASQLVAVAGNLAAMWTYGGDRVAYWAVTQLPMFGQLAALGLGTLCHTRRQALVGPYRDWCLSYSSDPR